MRQKDVIPSGTPRGTSTTQAAFPSARCLASTLGVTVLVTLAGAAAAQTMPADEAPSTQPMTFPSTQPATLPATMPATRAVVSRITGKELPAPPPEYTVLSNRTVFIKTRIPPPPPVPSATVTDTLPIVPPEATLVFNGVTNVDGVGYAIFEDTAAGKILGFKVGDTIASGKITAITLDGLDYEANGQTQRILLGQTLEGGDAPDLATRATVTGGLTTQPSSGSAAEDPILKMLRERRRRELGQ
jgi:hypothetical protein